MKIIAETAFNHNGDFDYLKNLILAAKNSQADYVTVQIFDPVSFCLEDYERFDIYQKTSFSHAEWNEVFTYCSELNIQLIPCTLDLKTLKFCYSSGFRLIKIHATDINNIPMLEYIKSKPDIRVLLETQCATNIDIEFCLSYIGHNVEGLLHGFSDYPTETEELRLNSLNYLKNRYNYPVGFADHSIDTIEIPLMCLAKQISFYEKHITVSRNDRNYDWQVSLNEDEFSFMVKKINNYRKSLGLEIKHPSKKESSYRNVLYKKHINKQFIRADYGYDYITNKFNYFNKSDCGIALIARLKSKRLSKKVLKPFYKDKIITDLYDSLETSGIPCFLATSFLKEDEELYNIFATAGKNCFKGDPESVLERMLSLSLKERWGSVFRVTGDNPLTNIELLKIMKDLMVSEDLDYVRTNNIPFGVSAELFSTKYLWNLYLNMDGSEQTEYLSWYVLNDKDCKKGCFDVQSKDDFKYVNFSIDYQSDYDFCLKFLNSTNKKEISKLQLTDLHEYDSESKFDLKKEVKLPHGNVFSLEGYLQFIDKTEYKIRKKINLKK